MFGKRRQQSGPRDQREVKIESLQNELDWLYLEDALVSVEVERFGQIQEHLKQLGVHDARKVPFMMDRDKRIEVLESELAKIRHQPDRERALRELIDTLKQG